MSRAATSAAISFNFHEGSLKLTEFSLQAAHGMHLASDWLRLFNARIERLPIPHEMSSISLACERIEPMQFADVDRFDKSRQRDREWSALTTLLKLRLGDGALRLPRCNANALPESTNALPESANTLAQSIASNLQVGDNADIRPAWLVDPPRRLTEREITAFTQSIHLQQPERIAENWSHPDGNVSTQRDYYIARTPDHRALWVYRERPRNDWFLQGVFA